MMKVMMNKKILTTLSIITISQIWWWACVGADPQINLLNQGCSQYNASCFYTHLNATFSDLKAQLLNGSKHFATAQQTKGSDPVYAMTQCRNYLSSADCLSCFAAAVSQIRNCSASNGARVVYDGCFLRMHRVEHECNMLGTSIELLRMYNDLSLQGGWNLKIESMLGVHNRPIAGAQ